MAGNRLVPRTRPHQGLSAHGVPNRRHEGVVLHDETSAPEPPEPPGADPPAAWWGRGELVTPLAPIGRPRLSRLRPCTAGFALNGLSF